MCGYFVLLGFLLFFSGPPGRLRIDWDGLELAVILLSLPPGCLWGMRGRVYRYVPLPSALGSISRDAFLSKVCCEVVFSTSSVSQKYLVAAQARQHKDRVREGGQPQKTD